MKFALHILLTILLCWLLQSFLPWWTMAIGAFVVGLIFGNSGFVSFLAGFLGAALLWFAMAWYIDASTDSILTARVAGILPTKTVGLLLLITSIIGGLVGGFASMTGGLITHRAKHRY